MTPAVAPHLLTRRSSRLEAQGVPFLPGLLLRAGRVHEICGTARRTLAATVARAQGGGVAWIAPPWTQEQLNGEGLCSFVEPGRVVFVSPSRVEDVLWAMEEALRAGVSLAVADLPEPPRLTPVRRLQLAAEAGARAGGRAPLGLLLVPGAGGAPGVETRWALAPCHEGEADAWRLDRLRARCAPPAAWTMTGAFDLAPPPPPAAEAS